MAKPITISIVGNAGPLKKAVKESEKALSDLGNSFKNAAKVFAVGAAAVGAGAVVAIKKASDLNETISKVGVIFGDADKEIQAFAKNAASSLGQTRQQALNAAATFGIFGKSAGLAGSDLAKFSTDFTTLASDLASFNNTSPEQAINAIGAALRGESEPLRQYGVLLNDATLKQAALELGIYDGNGALTAQQKILAAQKVIFEQTGDAQGDFARTSDGLANQTRILQAQLENVVTVIGTALLPIAQELVAWVSDHILPVIERWADAISEDGLSGLLQQITLDTRNWYGSMSAGQQIALSLTGTLGGLYIAMRTLTFAVQVTAAFKGLTAAIQGTQVAVIGLGGTWVQVASVIGVAVGAITASLYLLSQENFGVFKGMANAALDFADVVIDVFNAVAKSAAQWVNLMIDAINLLNPFADIPKFEVGDVIGNIGFRFSGVFEDGPRRGGMRIGAVPDRLDIAGITATGIGGGGGPLPPPGAGGGAGGGGGGSRGAGNGAGDGGTTINAGTVNFAAPIVDYMALGRTESAYQADLALGGVPGGLDYLYADLSESARLADAALLDTAQAPINITVNTVTADENLPTVIVDALQRYNLIYGPAEIEIAV